MQAKPFAFLPLLAWLVLSLTPPAHAADDMAWPEDDAAPAARPAAKHTRPQKAAPAKRPSAPSRPISPPAKVITPKAAAPSAKPNAPAKAKGEAAPTADKAKPSKPADDDDDEDVETVEDVGAVQTKGEATGDGNSVQIGAHADAGWTINKLWGHMHAALVHMPIAWLLAWSGAEVLALLWPHPWLLTAGLPIGLMTALSFAPSVYSGLMRLDELAGGESGYDVAPALLHRNLMLAAWTLVVIAVAIRLLRAQARSPLLRRFYLMCVFVSFALLAYSAHLGGVLVYGEDFFPW